MKPLAKSYYRKNLTTALPVILSFAGQSMVQIADTLMVGQLGATPLAAVSLAGAIIMNLLVLGLGISIGLTPIAGYSWAERDYRSVASYFQNSLLLNFIVGVLISLLLIGAMPLLSKIGQPEEVVSMMGDYFIYTALSIIPFMLFQAFKQFMEGSGNTRVSMNITLIANTINIVLNYLLIFGKLGMPQMGAAGAGLATLISRLFMPLAFWFIVTKDSHYSRYFKFFSQTNFSKIKQRRLLAMGLPISGQMSLEFLSLSAITLMMGWISTNSLAANQIAQTLISLTFMISNGVAAATTIHVSHSFGEGEIAEVEKNGYAGMHLSLLFMGSAALLFLLFGREIASLFTNSQEVIEIATKLLIVVALFELLDGLQVTALGALRGIMDVKISMVYAVISYLLISLPVAYIAGFVLNFKEVGLLSGFAVGLLIASFLFITRFKKQCNLLKKQKLTS